MIEHSAGNVVSRAYSNNDGQGRFVNVVFGVASLQDADSDVETGLLAVRNTVRDLELRKPREVLVVTSGLECDAEFMSALRGYYSQLAAEGTAVNFDESGSLGRPMTNAPREASSAEELKGAFRRATGVMHAAELTLLRAFALVSLGDTLLARGWHSPGSRRE